MSRQERRIRMGLCALNLTASAQLSGLVSSHGAEAVWHSILERQEGALGRRARSIDLDQLAAATHASRARFLIPGDPLWPQQLDDLGSVRLGDQGGIPIGLWVTGNPEALLPGRSVAMVGARAATAYGTAVAQAMAAELASAGWQVLSGLAYGIDAASHRGALAVGRSTVAVMATGIDLTYPTQHEGLRREIQGGGAVVSELAPGMRPVRASFLGRNRLIAALSQGVVVVEAGPRSGARNTAAWAGELGRVLAAVPGPVTSSLSATPHHLIRESIATLVANAEQVMALCSPIGEQQELPLRGEDRPIDALPTRLRTVREAIPAGAVATLPQLAASTGLGIPELLAAVGELVELGWVEESAGGWRLPRRHLG